MKVKKIRTTSDAHNFCTGLINDFESGVIDKEECIKLLRDYTFQIHDVFFEVAKREVKTNPNFFEVTDKRNREAILKQL